MIYVLVRENKYAYNLLEGPPGKLLAELVKEFCESQGVQLDDASYIHFIRWVKEKHGLRELVYSQDFRTWSFKEHWFRQHPKIGDEISAQRLGEAPLWEPPVREEIPE